MGVTGDILGQVEPEWRGRLRPRYKDELPFQPPPSLKYGKRHQYGNFDDRLAHLAGEVVGMDSSTWFEHLYKKIAHIRNLELQALSDLRFKVRRRQLLEETLRIQNTRWTA